MQHLPATDLSLVTDLSRRSVRRSSGCRRRRAAPTGCSGTTRSSETTRTRRRSSASPPAPTTARRRRPWMAPGSPAFRRKERAPSDAVFVFPCRTIRWLCACAYAGDELDTQLEHAPVGAVLQHDVVRRRLHLQELPLAALADDIADVHPVENERC